MSNTAALSRALDTTTRTSYLTIIKKTTINKPRQKVHRKKRAYKNIKYRTRKYLLNLPNIAKKYVLCMQGYLQAQLCAAKLWETCILWTSAHLWIYKRAREGVNAEKGTMFHWQCSDQRNWWKSEDFDEKSKLLNILTDYNVYIIFKVLLSLINIGIF